MAPWAVVALAAAVWFSAAAGCGDSGTSEPTGGLGASPPPWPMMVDNQVQLLSPCTGPSLTFFQGETPVDVPTGTTQLVDIPQLFGVYEIGFQVNGWYWRCAGAGDCPNPSGCQNPDNAGQVAIQVTPGGAPGSCTSAVLVKNFDSFTCDTSVPNASDVLTVTLEDPTTCLVRVEASGLTSLDPTAGCCDCHSCTAPPGQQTHCR
jgi:hypothetical protein